MMCSEQLLYSKVVGSSMMCNFCIGHSSICQSFWVRRFEFQVLRKLCALNGFKIGSNEKYVNRKIGGDCMIYNFCFGHSFIWDCFRIDYGHPVQSITFSLKLSGRCDRLWTIYGATSLKWSHSFLWCLGRQNMSPHKILGFSDKWLNYWIFLMFMDYEARQAAAEIWGTRWCVVRKCCIETL